MKELYILCQGYHRKRGGMMRKGQAVREKMKLIFSVYPLDVP